MDTDAIIQTLFLENGEAQKCENTSKKENIYYYKNENGLKYQINLKEYYKMAKVSYDFCKIFMQKVLDLWFKNKYFQEFGITKANVFIFSWGNQRFCK